MSRNPKEILHPTHTRCQVPAFFSCRFAGRGQRLQWLQQKLRHQKVWQVWQECLDTPRSEDRKACLEEMLHVRHSRNLPKVPYVGPVLGQEYTARAAGSVDTPLQLAAEAAQQSGSRES